LPLPRSHALRKAEEGVMSERMSDGRLKDLEEITSALHITHFYRDFRAPLAEACREIRELRAELDALNKPRTLDVLRGQSELCRELKATIEGHEAAMREAVRVLCFARGNSFAREAKYAIRTRLKEKP
jgi:hypothetical protein